MLKLKTLRVRFALWVAGLLLAVLAVFGAFVYVDMAQGLSASMDDALRMNALQTAGAVNIENGQFNLSDSMPDNSASSDPGLHGLTIRVLDGTGKVIQSMGPYQTLSLTTESLAVVLQGQPSFATVPDLSSGGLVRVYSDPIVDNGHLVGVIQVAQSLGSITQTLNRLLVALLVGVPALVLAAAFGGYLLAARALKPVDHITRTARRISAQDLSARLNFPATDDELGRLAATFDSMLARLDQAFQRERQFTSDASHELRTPLTAMQAILSVVREERRTPDDYEQALDDIAEEANRLRSLVGSLLRLARGGGHQPAVRGKVDLSSLLRDVADSLRPLAEAKGLTLTCTTPDDLELMGDGDDLIRLFVNLIDNAVKYTEHGGVDIKALSVGDSLNITIADTGSGISAQHLPHIFDRFYRVDASRTSPGAGLGLAIALDIARAHGGTIGVSSVECSGTTFTVRLPC